MEIKLLEIRDRMTFIQAIAISTKPSNHGQRYLLASAGYGSDSACILFGYAGGKGQLTYNAHDWPDSRTMYNAHKYVKEHFDELKDGDVVDVEFILGETEEKKISQQFEDLSHGLS